LCIGIDERKYIRVTNKDLWNNHKVDSYKKKSKYSNMKMLYQNAVYKSLNLNLSPSTSSARSGTGSRDISLRSRENKNVSAKKMPTSTKAFEQASTDFKFHVKNDETSSERLLKFRKPQKDLKRQKSQNSKLPNVSQERISGLSKQF